MAEQVAKIKLEYEVDESKLARIIKAAEQAAAAIQGAGTQLDQLFTSAEATLDRIIQKVQGINGTLTINAQEGGGGGGKGKTLEDEKEIIRLKEESYRKQKEDNIAYQNKLNEDRLEKQKQLNELALQHQRDLDDLRRQQATDSQGNNREEEEKKILEMRKKFQEDKKKDDIEHEKILTEERLRKQKELNDLEIEQTKKKVEIAEAAQAAAQEARLKALEEYNAKKLKAEEDAAAAKKAREDEAENMRNLRHQENLKRIDEIGNKRLGYQQYSQQMRQQASAQKPKKEKVEKEEKQAKEEVIQESEDLARALKKTAREFDYVAVRVLAFAGAITGLTIFLQNKLGEIGLYSQQFDVGGSDLYVFGRFVQSVGGDFEEGIKTFAHFADIAKQIKAGTGGNLLYEGFSQYGAGDAAAAILAGNSEEGIRAVAQTIFNAIQANMVDGQLTAAGHELLKRSGLDAKTALSIINAGGLPAVDTFWEMYEVSQELVKNAKAFRVNIGRVEALFGHLTVLISAAIAPSITHIANVLEWLISDTEDWVSTFRAIGYFIEGMVYAFAGLLWIVREVGDLFDTWLGKYLLKAVAIIGTLAGVFLIVSKVVLAIAGAFRAIWGVIVAIPAVFQLVLTTVRAIFAGIVAIGTSALAPVIAAVLALISFLYIVYELIEIITGKSLYDWSLSNWEWLKGSLFSEGNVNTNPATASSTRNQEITNNVTINTDERDPHTLSNFIVDRVRDFYHNDGYN